jgi:hypothetical protein
MARTIPLKTTLDDTGLCRRQPAAALRSHTPLCPAADSAARQTARVVASHAQQRSLHPLPDAPGQPQDAAPPRRDREGPKRAQEEHWLGEVEGIDSTLTFLRAKQAEAARLAKRIVTGLGIPRPRPEETQ